ncbi:rhomboid-like protein [Kitasatospora sp. NPDC056273]|uniref:rhomboid-like protein n=1 Tax=Kitasatospora sp. NPDC056273 TaxID=3345769 RepID=UPI0035E3A07A
MAGSTARGARAHRRPWWARAVHAVWAYVRRAPGTYTWLAVLLVTTQVIRHVDPATADRILERRSTNLHHLQVSPVRVLVTSALWIAGGGWPFYFLLYNLFHVPAERWLGTLRWISVAALAHVGATYLSEGVLGWAIHRGLASPRALYTLDYGVSYALAGVVAVLTYLIVRPWRYLYAVGVLVVYGLGVQQSRDYTSIGHFSAALIGFACYPLTRDRPGSFDPVASVRAGCRRVRGRSGRPTPSARSSVWRVWRVTSAGAAGQVPRRSGPVGPR